MDLVTPTFTNPTQITNPPFPISELTQVIQLGDEAGDALRFEVTLLPETKIIDWDGEQIETVVSQFVAYANGRVAEVAVDFFAQADDGAVWYFGEDVTNYEEGVIANHDGTWLAGKDGPPGMIMPADPQVGDVYRPENMPGFAFEQVTVKQVGETVAGPLGPVDGAIIIQELLMSGLLEDKTYAPGYGEFHFAVPADKELVNMALAVPTDAAPGPVPDALTTVGSGADMVFDLAPAGDWAAITGQVEAMVAAWDSHLSGDVPTLLGEHMSAALDSLATAVDGQEAAAVRQAAIDVAQAGLDLQLQFRPPADVDQDRARRVGSPGRDRYRGWRRRCDRRRQGDHRHDQSPDRIGQKAQAGQARSNKMKRVGAGRRRSHPPSRVALGSTRGQTRQGEPRCSS